MYHPQNSLLHFPPLSPSNLSSYLLSSYTHLFSLPNLEYIFLRMIHQSAIKYDLNILGIWWRNPKEHPYCQLKWYGHCRWMFCLCWLSIPLLPGILWRADAIPGPKNMDFSSINHLFCIWYPPPKNTVQFPEENLDRYQCTNHRWASRTPIKPKRNRYIVSLARRLKKNIV